MVTRLSDSHPWVSSYNKLFEHPSLSSLHCNNESLGKYFHLILWELIILLCPISDLWSLFMRTVENLVKRNTCLGLYCKYTTFWWKSPLFPKVLSMCNTLKSKCEVRTCHIFDTKLLGLGEGLTKENLSNLLVFVAPSILP